MRRARSRLGFTLVELMVSLSLAGTVALLAGGLAFETTRATDLGTAYVGDVLGLRRALDTMERDVRGGAQVRAEGAGLAVRMPDGEVVYAVERGDLVQTTASVRRVLAHNVAAFATRQEGALVTVELTLGARAAAASRRATVTTSVRTRTAPENAR